MKGTFEDAIASPGEDMSDLLQVAPILAQRFEGFLNTIDDIVRVLDSGDFNCDRVQPQLDQLYSTMCEEYPGSVVVRHSWSRFKTLAVLDREEAKAPAPYEMDTTTSNSPETVQPPYEMDTMMSNSPIDAPYDMDTTTSNSPKMAHTLDDMDSTRSSSPTDIPFAQRRSASPAQKVPKEPFDEVEHFTTLSPEKHIYTPSSSSQRTPLMTLDSPMSMNRFMTSHSGDTLASQSLVQQSLEADLRQNPANDPTSTVTKTRVHGGQGGAPPSSKKSRLRAAPSANSPVNTLSASPPRTLSNRSTLPDYMQNMMDNYSGNTPASQSAVRQYLEEDLKQHPAADLIYIERKPGVHGKRGGIVKAICRECDYEGTFQKAAEHVTSAHWKLSLWSCTVPNCTQAYHRKHDLERHHKGAHQIPTSRAARRVKPVIVPATTSADPGSPNNPSTSSLYSSGPYSTGTQSLSSGNSGGSSLYREPLSSASAVDGPLSYGSDPKHIFGLQSTPSTSTHASFPPEGQESGGRTARHGTDIQQPSSRSFNSSRFSFAPHRQTLPTIAASPSVGQYAPGMQRSTSAKLDLDEDSGSDDLEHRPY
ncbi:hypothetical protein M408DRAFT_328312 [Serendipita vermifera MAFF 305830]|uniref:C2H2-type domain-containing protein n=1 Tax=Serendipita vermifera MAFF 305830 TaxID=933852 RepID=A0A0C2WVT6_SERVB|nr:hypothetical protein M408DRAFT_328312 [Serendipita vermifera MAFF 305830]